MDFLTLKDQGRRLADLVRVDPKVKLVAGLHTEADETETSRCGIRGGTWRLYVWPYGWLEPAGFDITHPVPADVAKRLGGIYERHLVGDLPWISCGRSEAVFYVRPLQTQELE